jgi:hypothetical protein
MNTVDNDIFTGLCIIMIYAPFFVHLTQKVNTVSYNWHQLSFSLSLTFHMLLLSSETTQALLVEETGIPGENHRPTASY